MNSSIAFPKVFRPATAMALASFKVCGGSSRAPWSMCTLQLDAIRDLEDAAARQTVAESPPAARLGIFGSAAAQPGRARCRSHTFFLVDEPAVFAYRQDSNLQPDRYERKVLPVEAAPRGREGTCSSPDVRGAEASLGGTSPNLYGVLQGLSGRSKGPTTFSADRSNLSHAGASVWERQSHLR
jgi:hypothetical protein